jgi:uncharacterized protein (TIGR02147 family)
MQQASSEIYIDLLKKVLNRRKENNPAYSLRAFALYLDISVTSLSRILNGKRSLTLERALNWQDKLGLNTDEQSEFLEAIQKDEYERLNETERNERELNKKLDYDLIRLDQFEIISKWYYLTILNLVEIKGFILDENSVAQCLNIKKEDALEAISRLERLKLIGKTDGKYRRLKKSIETPSDIPSTAIKNYQSENISRALESLEIDSVEIRDITSITMPMNLNKLTEAKKKIKNFRREMSLLAQSGENEQVYSLNIQLFPQTRLKS